MTLIDNALVFRGQLAMIDPRFYECVDLFAELHGRTVAEVRAHPIWNFLHPRWPAESLGPLAARVANAGAHLADILGRTGPDYAEAVDALDRASRALERMCARQPGDAVAPPAVRTEHTPWQPRGDGHALKHGVHEAFQREGARKARARAASESARAAPAPMSGSAAR
ncbi:hypothetical protein T492DRAFT_527138 [Pavlovales sp. CCMP2436]|nr:hypothetical protein T492DRAFT_527138 [Pavlovales sp. CCMP2436]